MIDSMTVERALGEIRSKALVHQDDIIDRLIKDYVEPELARLREFEAREAMVTNLMAAWIDVIDGKKTLSQFEELVKRSEAEMCRAIECLGRRDKIRKLEGALDALREVAKWARDGEILYMDLEHETAVVEQQLAEARAGK